MPPERRRLPARVAEAVNQIRMRYAARAAHLEMRMAVVVQRALDRFLSQVRRAVLGSSGAPDMGAFPSDQVWTRELDERVVPELAAAFDEGWSRRPDSPDSPERPQRPDSPDVYRVAYLATARNRITTIPDQVYRLLSDSLAEGLDAGEGIPALRKRVSEVLAQERAASRFDAERIARTEVHAAVNAGTYDAARAHAKRTGERMTKMWLATQDTRTRPAHAAAHLQQVPLAETYQVGGERLKFPGDPTGSGGNVINCRCAMVTFSDLAADILNQRELIASGRTHG